MLLFLFFIALSGNASQLDEIRRLAQGGAAQLALSTMDRLQPELLADKQKWVEWEKLRIAIYQQSRDWQALTQRVDEFPAHLPADFIYWAQTEQARAYITLQQGDKALAILQNLVWNLPADAAITAQWLPQWRRLIIDSYINDQQLADAQVATSRFYQDYPKQEIADILLRARIALINGQPDDALFLLRPHADVPRVATLYLLAQLRSLHQPANKIVRAGIGQLQSDTIDDSLKPLLWAIIAEGAKRSGDRATTANALEHVLADKDAQNLPDGLFTYSADSLWNSYIDFATWYGNRQQFLIGQDQQWFKAARAAEKKQPVRARSLYALLMLKGQEENFRIRAIERFIALMKGREQGNSLLKQLFMDSSQFARKENIPAEIRHALVDIALSQSDIELASDLMATIKEPPAGADNFFWHLRRARIFILGGDELYGIQALQKLIGSYAIIPRAQIDRLLQVIFDLQTLGEHQKAIELLNMVLSKALDAEVKREIFFWIADSHKAEQAHRQAARFYMKSATHIAEKDMDPWAQTARYQAAESLARAGLLDDARTLFRQLLKVTREPARRAVLQHELQKLWLMKGNRSNKVFKIQ
jgi:hypothetical protein